VRDLQGFIVDLDGTIALHTEDERAHYDYSKVKYDRPNKPIITVVQRLAHSLFISEDNPYRPRIEPVFMSGRADESDGKVRRDTIDWLVDNIGFPREYYTKRLFMRPEFLIDDYGEIRAGHRDFRPDFIVKEELYFQKVEPYFDIQFAIDDRPQVLKMWQRLGIPTLAVGTPWIPF
jgi:hypothetical protein